MRQNHVLEYRDGNHGLRSTFFIIISCSRTRDGRRDEPDQVVVFSKPDCAVLKQLRKTLNGMGVKYRVLIQEGAFFAKALRVLMAAWIVLGR
jgi:hypothetical protein